MRGMAAVLVLVLVLSFAGGLVLLDASGTGERSESQRLFAAAELERARADADAQRMAAERLNAEQAHRLAMETVPVVVAVVGGVFLAALVVFLVWDARDRRRAEQAAARAALPAVRVLVLPVVMSSADSRGELWRSVSAAAARAALHPGDGIHLDGDGTSSYS